jgi:hypothetical protein
MRFSRHFSFGIFYSSLTEIAKDQAKATSGDFSDVHLSRCAMPENDDLHIILLCFLSVNQHLPKA